MSDLYYSAPYQLPGAGSAVVGGGGSTHLTGAQTISQARRNLSAPRLGQAEYPDGYLGTVTSRRADRLANSGARTAQRNNNRPTTRGIHKGTRLSAADYQWPADFHPMTGIEHQLRGRRWTATGNPEGTPLRNPTKTPGTEDQPRTDLRSLLPAWR
ncbi:hypothetical protein ADL22_12220 [Streptomyces sp. NRRL F-4489]|uniref:hypothetical protein n=1 Tax=Streptomyces sp. NRRL F-4489 TaxID=1609095 RepID=UPI0007468366|nr:hypothetical protein [Streptomyces sp. NRRL F-4489]KUL44702.1 hypothetical protein ADL22_12220 [Streptomyces sp. NRRL F-4489]